MRDAEHFVYTTNRVVKIYWTGKEDVSLIELSVFKKLMQEYGGQLPLLTLDEFFNGNTDEYSIAPNQWGYGRPPLSEMWKMLNKIQSIPSVDWVRVVLHDDTEIEECNGKETLNLYGDTIVLCTTSELNEMENLVNCKLLCSDGVVVIKDSEINIFSLIPPVPEGFMCLEIVWD